MLEGIRKRRNSIVILLAFAAIILVFVFWGVGPNQGGKPEDGAVAIVDGERIEAREYSNLYNREVENYRNNLKDKFTEEVARKLNLRQRALDVLINRTLAIKQAKADGVKITDKDVQDAIKAIPFFQKNGAFDRDLYFNVLNANRIKPADFEKSIEGDLYTSKIRDKVIKDVAVTDQEVKAAYMKENRKFNMDYVVLDAASFAPGIKVTDDEAKDYLSKNGSLFMTKPKVKAFYALATLDGLTRNIKVTDQEAKEYYDKNPKDFELPPSAKARHILIRPDSNAADKEKAKLEAKKKAEEILVRIKAGEDFAALARQFSQDPGSAKNGGDLGWFQKGVMVKQFEDGVFNTKKGEVSPVVETEYGFHIIKVEDRVESGVAPFNKAAENIKRMLKAKKAESVSREVFAKVDADFKAAKSVEELKKAAAANGLKATVTGFVSEDDKTSELVKNEALADSAFVLKAGDVSAPIQTHEGIYVLKVLERSDAHVPDYKDISGRVKERLLSEKAREAASKKAQEVLDRVKGGSDIATAAKAEKLKADSTGYFSKSEGFMPRLGIFTGDKEKLFELTSSAPVYPEVIAQNDKFYVLKLKETKEADEAAFEGKKNELKARLLMMKQEDALGNWLKDLRSKAKIQIFENNM